MIKLSENDKKILNKMIRKISKEKLKKNWEEIIKFTPAPSGSEQEEQIIQFIFHKLEEYGLKPKMYRYDAYMSEPKWSKLEILDPKKTEIQCTAYQQVGTTSPEGIEGEVIYLELDELGNTDCSGKIILVEQETNDSLRGLQAGLQYPKMLELQKMGAKGLIVIEKDSYAPTVIHQFADFSVSGNPTPDNFHLIQTIPASVAVSYQDGQLLKTFIKKSRLQVRITSVVETAWKKVPLIVADIHGNREPEKYLLVDGHVDTPPFSPGVTDNTSGDAALLELARVLNEHREELDRSVRFFFMTGHEIGRYAGSTWYNDTFWHDIRYNCIGVLNIDSPGAEGAIECGPAPILEVQDAVIDSNKAVTGVEIETRRWEDRTADASFWATGIPHTYLISVRPKGLFDPFIDFSGGGWWWHTTWATFDRGDINVLEKDVKINLHYIFRMTNCRILPMNFTPYAEYMLKILEDLQAKADKVRSFFNLQPVLEEAKRFKELSLLLEDAVQKNIDQDGQGVVALLNHCLMWVGRHIHPAVHSDADKTNQADMYLLGITPFPRLQGILELAKMSLYHKPEFKMLHTKLLRERNYVVDGFYLANELIENTLDKIKKVGGEK